MRYKFCVITEVPDPEKSDGNLAMAIVYSLPQEIRGLVALKGRQEVFTLGEILVLDDSGREVSGHGRKPIKWYVETETFEDIEDAIQKSIEVKSW